MNRLPKQLRRQVAADRSAPPCRCGHIQAAHSITKRMCYGGPTCGCASYEPAPWPPADHRDEYDPSPLPVERGIQ